MCLSKTDDAKDDPEKKDDEELERKSSRKDLCKHCFWFQVFLKILDGSDTSHPKDSFFFKHVMNLPSSCEAIAEDAETNVQKWIAEIPGEKRALPDGYSFND